MHKYGIDLDKFNLMGEVYNKAAKNPNEISSEEEEDKFYPNKNVKNGYGDKYDPGRGNYMMQGPSLIDGVYN